jgi:hypothetical protein
VPITDALAQALRELLNVVYADIETWEDWENEHPMYDEYVEARDVLRRYDEGV